MGRRILVVEDSPTQAEQLRLLLEGEGYAVEVAADGRQGLEQARRAAPELIISEVVMPGLDGYAFCRAVKSAPATSAIPFVLLTERRTALDILRGLEHGADNFITKPFENAVLLERVRRIFAQLEGREPGRLPVEVSLRLAGRQVLITADRQQIVELLFSTFEELCRTNDSLAAARRTVEEQARGLEARAAERSLELRSLFDGVPVGLFRQTPEGRLLDANPALIQMLGYPDLPSLMAARAADVLPGRDDRRRWRELIEREGVVRGLEVEARRPDGATVWLRLSGRLTRDAAGRVLHYEGAAEDVTARRHAEEIARALAEVGRELVGTLDPAQAAERVVAAVLELLRARRAILYRLDPASSRLVCVATAGEGDAAGWIGQTLPPEAGLAGRAIAEGRPFRTSDALTDPAVSLPEWLRLRIQAEGYRAVVGIPLTAMGETVGALVLADRVGRVFGEEDVRLLSAFADQAALALRNARLYAEATRRRDEAEELARVARSLTESLDAGAVADRIVDSALTLFGARSAGFRLLQPDGSLVAAAADPSGGHAGAGDVLARGVGLSGRVVVDAAPVWTSDILADPRLVVDDGVRQRAVTTGVHAYLGVPLRVKGKTIGVLSVGDRPGRRFSESEVALLQALGDQAALALENARHHAALQVRAARLRTLGQLNRLVSSSLDLDVVLREIARAAAQLMEAPHASFWLADPASRTLELSATSDDAAFADFPLKRFTFDQGSLGWVAAHREALSIPDVLADARIVAPEWWRAHGLRSFLGVPVVAEDSLLAVLALNGREPFRVEPADEELLGSFVAQAATAIRNARLFAESDRRRRAAEALAEAQHGLSQLLDPEEAARRTVASVHALFGAVTATLYRVEPESGDLVALAATEAVEPAGGPRLVLPAGTGVSGRAVAERQPILTRDALADPAITLTPEVRARAERTGYRAVLAVPLLSRDRVIGALAIGRALGQSFDGEEVRLAQAFAAQAALALENARLFEELAAAHRRHELVTEALADVVFMLDVEGRFVLTNAAAERLTGYPLDELRGRPFSELIVPEDLPLLTERFRRAFGGEAVSPQVEVRIVRQDGRQVPVELSMANLVLDGRITGRVGVARDLSERKALEAQLRQAQKMEAVGQLAGGVAHDFNNLLTVITGRSQLLLRRLEPGDPRRRHVELIEKAAGRAAALTQQLLAFSRKQVLQPKVLDLKAVVAGVEKMLRRLIGEDVELVTVADPALGRVKADPGQLEQVILNLAVNARDAMPRGGRLTIETANVELDRAFVEGHEGAQVGPHVRLRVADTGVGMDAGVQSHLFEPFFTTKSPGKGTGLGLAMVYGIVKQSGGHVAVESAPGQGARFDVYLPRLDDAEAAGEGSAPEGEPGQGSETVLLVEDEESVRELALEILQMHGYTVLVARHGAEALELTDRHPGPVHLLVSDVVMPHMSGRELAERLTIRRPGMKVLYISGYTDDAILRHGVREAGVALLPKPFTPDALARAVRARLDGEP